MGYDSRSLSVFLDEIASADVAPAGGTAGAVVGAIGTACCEMVCIHLQRGDVPTDEDLGAIRKGLADRRTRMLDLAAADAEVVDELFAAREDAADPSAEKRSVGVPLSLAEACLDTLEYAAILSGAADRPVIADAATGAYITRAALQAAVFTARRNLETVDDADSTRDSERRAAEVLAASEPAFDAVLANVDGDG